MINKLPYFISLLILLFTTNAYSEETPKFYNDSAEDLFYDAPLESYKMAEKALAAAHKVSSTHEIVRAYVNLSRYYTFKENYQRSLDSLYVGVEYINDIPRETAEQLLLSISQNHVILHSDNLTFDQFINSNDEEKFWRKNYNVLIKLSAYYYNNYNYLNANDNLQKALVLAQNLQDSTYISEVNYQIGRLAVAIEKYDRSLVYFNKSLPYTLASNDSVRASKIYSYMGESQMILNEYITADSLFQLALSYSSQQNENQYLVLKNLGKFHFNQGKYATSRSYYNKALQSMGNNFDAEKAFIFNELGDLSIINHSLSESKMYYDSAIWYSKRFQDFKNLEEALVGLSDIAERRKDYKLSNELLKNSKIAQAKSNEQKEMEAISYSNAYFDTYFKDLQIIDLRQDKYIKDLILEQEKVKTNLLIVILIVVLLGGVLLVLWFLQTRKNAKLEREKAKVAREHNDELMLINDVLSQSQKELLNANQIKDRMFSVIGHDAKGPLISVRNQVFGLIGKVDKDSSVYEELVNSEILIDNVIRLINDLLNWAMLQDEKIELNIEKVDFKEILETNLSLYKQVIDRKNIAFDINLPSNTILDTDYQLLSFCVRNLLSNALKYSPEGGEIEISSKRKETSFSLSISDNGPGIGEHQRETIFLMPESFIAPSPDREGLGFGLPMTARFVKLLKGDISLTSKLNEGSKFQLTIPVG
ncbi:HAMP domain-containing histidine kinase [Flammeovirga yaeyamensis]|uniref:histidine kinase n=1 Tax=Flammeovirga yaeyamensis TaxID=367791 RepID=A0AAX1N8W6_9BACT|nr:HAMP domain-containing sensor histidine kinase [Flammeovirga yaeyamensis]MBB3699000.1 signal transduction histidine kinase [Flammeovirga yaeyamensis]NMF36434.1 HAMP domain-containing histidine kinase [Flammeovirga yaeyamensis]QWG03606.1 HAMP domain-containing histidine kinase [Flammeovirga yaeyamensis]